VAYHLVDLSHLLLVFAEEDNQRREASKDQVKRLLGTNEASKVIIPTQLGEELNQHVVVQTDLNVFIVFESATQNSDNEVEHEHCVDQQENHLEILSEDLDCF
jgi:hypothetical protein